MVFYNLRKCFFPKSTTFPHHRYMDLADCIDFCMNLPEVEETTPFGPEVIVFKVAGKMFALTNPDDVPPRMNLKCEPKRAEELRKAVEAITVRYGEKALPRVTISLGVAIAPDHGTLPQDLLRAADDALYDAKGQGRNRVCTAGGIQPAPMVQPKPTTQPSRIAAE